MASYQNITKTDKSTSQPGGLRAVTLDDHREQNRMTYQHRAACLVASCLAANTLTSQAASPSPTVVANFNQQVTGVAVTKTGRVFVNFPRWKRDVPISVAEVKKDGTLKPFPDAAWSSWCVTALHIQEMAQFHKKGSTQSGPWQLFKAGKPHK